MAGIYAIAMPRQSRSDFVVDERFSAGEAIGEDEVLAESN
jgi:hypothetical protein